MGQQIVRAVLSGHIGADVQATALWAVIMPWPRITRSTLEAIRRNMQLLKKSTDNGLLHAGHDYQASGISACIHHTFGHAKALTAFLELPPVKTQQYKALPRDNAYGVKYFRDIRTWLVAEGSVAFYMYRFRCGI